jgi:hypothetical protein
MVPWKTDYSLDVMRVIIERKFENDNITMANGPVREHMFVPGGSAFEHKLVHKEVIAH